MLEEPGDYGEAADDDSDCKLDVGPDSEWDEIVTEIGGLGNSPGVVRSDDGGDTSARN